MTTPRKIFYSADIELLNDDPTSNKPYVVVTCNDGSQIAISLNLAENIGNIGRGARERYEAQHGR